MKMEEIFENFKSFVEERKNLQEQINQVERKRNELAKERNVSPNFIRYLSTPANLRRINKRKNNKPSKALISVKLGYEE